MNEDALTVEQEGPALDELLKEYERAGVSSERLSECDDVRLTRWEGQSSDGRKWDKNLPDGRRALPWDGASDTRVPLADEVINEMVEGLVVAFRRARIRVQGVESGDMSDAAAVQMFLQQMVRGKLRQALRDEAEYLAQYAYGYGWSAVYVGWCREVSKRRRKVGLDEALKGYQQMEGDAVGLRELILNPDLEAEAVEGVRALFDAAVRKLAPGLYEIELPELSDADARRYVRELREKQEADVVLPYVSRNEPEAIALKPWEEILLPPETTDVQQARAVFWRQYLSPAVVRGKVVSEGWDETWAEEAIKHAGAVSVWAVPTTGAGMVRLQDGRFQTSSGDADGLVEVVHGYVRKNDKDGVPAVWCTTFCPHVKPALTNGHDLVAKHELVDYAHGRYPFVLFRRERLDRGYDQSRSVCEVAGTWQNEEKEQRDMLFNRAHWDTLPPLVVPKLMGMDYKLGPGAQLPEARSNGLRFLDGPAKSPEVALHLIDAIERRTDKYFGRASEKLPPFVGQMKAEKRVGDYLDVWSDVLLMMLALTAQYRPEEIERVTGRELRLNPADVLDQLDLVLTFDVRELDPDYMLQKMDIVSKAILPEDAAGVIDRAKLTALKLRWLDPSLADEIVQDRGPATQAMYREVNNQVAMMALGNEAEYTENDPAAAMKMQFMRDIVRRNPKYQQLLQQDERFRTLLVNYEKNLQQSVVQQQNKMVGRLGVESVGAAG